MKELWQTLFEIMLFRANPGQLPRSMTSLATVAATVFALNFFAYLIPVDGSRPSPGKLLVAAIGVIAIYFFVLEIYRKRERVLQTMTAILGTDCIASVLLLLLIGVSSTLGLSDQALLGPQLLIQLWALMVTARILSDALDWPLFPGAVLAVVVSFGTLVFLFGDLPPAGGNP